MGIGALLIGLAALIVVAAYVAAPFHRDSRGEDVDAQIEAWIAAARQEDGAAPSLTTAVSNGPVPRRSAVEITAGVDITAGTEKSGNYCHQCGEPVQPNYRFCRNCGTRLVAGGPIVSDDI